MCKQQVIFEMYGFGLVYFYLTSHWISIMEYSGQCGLIYTKGPVTAVLLLPEVEPELMTRWTPKLEHGVNQNPS